MEYRRDFKKYAAYRAQQARDQEIDARIVDLGVKVESLYKELRQRLPEFYDQNPEAKQQKPLDDNP